MKRTVGLSLVLCATLALSGCGKGNPTTTTAADTGDNAVASAQPGRPAASTAKLPVRETAPDGVVTQFLQALRSGDEKTAEALLTTKAREETAKHDLAVQPPGTPSATYQVGQVEYANEQKTAAYVSSVWTEADHQGQAESYEIIWVMREESHGWRIAGMATKLSPQDPEPLFLNFEDPAEMLRKWEEAEATVAARNNAGTDAGGTVQR